MSFGCIFGATDLYPRFDQAILGHKTESEVFWHFPLVPSSVRPSILRSYNKELELFSIVRCLELQNSFGPTEADFSLIESVLKLDFHLLFWAIPHPMHGFYCPNVTLLLYPWAIPHPILGPLVTVLLFTNGSSKFELPKRPTKIIFFFFIYIFRVQISHLWKQGNNWKYACEQIVMLRPYFENKISLTPMMHLSCIISCNLGGCLETLKISSYFLYESELSF